MSKSIYIDVCALSRPFDDQNYMRIRLETEALNLILLKIREGKLKLLFSPVHIIEIEAIPDTFERIELQTILNELGVPIKGDMSKIRARAEDLVSSGFGIADAAHVAFAEYSGAEFISCDAKLLKKCLTFKTKVWCGNPVSFCEKEGLK
jgi:predicted nucleic acid-binding protein